MLAGTKYTNRHNQICQYLHWCILKDINPSNVPDLWYQHKPEPTTTYEEKTIMWDVPQITDARTLHNRPDILIVDRKTRKGTIIDVAVPNDRNINVKVAEKITKYKDLKIELQKMYDLIQVEIIPVIIGALGTVGKNFKNYVHKISPRANCDTIQKTAILGTAHIVRNFLT